MCLSGDYGIWFLPLNQKPEFLGSTEDRSEREENFNKVTFWHFVSLFFRFEEAGKGCEPKKEHV